MVERLHLQRLVAERALLRPCSCARRAPPLRRREIPARPECRAFRARHCRWRPPRRPCNPLLTLRNNSPLGFAFSTTGCSASKRELARKTTAALRDEGHASGPAFLARGTARHLCALLAYLGGIAVLSIAAAQIFQSPPAIRQRRSPPEHWIEIEKPFPAFALSIPEAADVPSNYAIRRNVAGGGRKDILTLGEPDRRCTLSAGRDLPAGQRDRRLSAAANATDRAARPRSGRSPPAHASEPLASKFGPLASSPSTRRIGTPRHCLGFVRAYDDPRLQLSGWFCQRRRIHPALDARLRARPADAAVRRQRAESRRPVCAGRTQPQLLRPARSDPGADAEIQLLWKALATRPEPRRIGR